MKTTLEIYGQYLLNTQINYTCTNLADHVEKLSHDSVHRFLKDSQLSPHLVWHRVKDQIVFSKSGCLLFDDTVLEKIFSFKIEAVRRQYSGNKHGIINGIGVVNCVYFNPETEQYWVLDFRVFDPDTDGKTKIDHVFDMLKLVHERAVLYRYALMDSWYATTDLMKFFIQNERIFYCPVKKNRKVDESGGELPYVQACQLDWSEQDLVKGKTVKLHGFPMDTKVKLFRVEVSSDRTEHLVTNDCTQSSTAAARLESAQRWKIEQFHREEKQLTGIAKCQCRKNRSQRNHICAAVLVWVRLNEMAHQAQMTVYQIKNQLLDDYLFFQMAKPSIAFK
jgi:Transposase DDE domain